MTTNVFCTLLIKLNTTVYCVLRAESCISPREKKSNRTYFLLQYLLAI